MIETSVTGAGDSRTLSAIFARQPRSNSIIVADGYGIRISVNRGHLTIEDGLSSARRKRVIPKQPREVKRIVILGGNGAITFDAMRWCSDLGIGIVQIERDGRLLMTTPGLTELASEDARLISAQVRAQDSPDVSLRIIRSMQAAKISGQADVAREVLKNDRESTSIADAARRISTCRALGDMLGTEGSAAKCYWRAWQQTVYAPFAPDRLSLIPAHWYQFSSRTSLRNPNKAGKNATDPINAMLNYAYAIAESECRIACLIMGLNPVIGLGHGKSRRKDSLVYDIMESVRPHADRAVLSLLDTGRGVPLDPDTGKPGYLSTRWFCESGSGVVSLVAPLTHVISERVMAAVATDAGRSAEYVTRVIGEASNVRVRPHSIRGQVTLGVVQERRGTGGKTVPVRLADDTTPVDVIPDSLWARIAPLIPPDPSKRCPDLRSVTAGITVREFHQTPWHSIPAGLGISSDACRTRFVRWNELGAWEKIKREIVKSGLH